MEQRRDYVEFMLHSSELMAGGSPTFTTSDRIERLFDDLEELFDAARQHWAGATLSEYRDNVRPAAGGRPEATAEPPKPQDAMVGRRSPMSAVSTG